MTKRSITNDSIMDQSTIENLIIMAEDEGTATLFSEVSKSFERKYERF